MAGPIINCGQLVGAGCTRHVNACFDTQNLADLSAICLHYRFAATAIIATRHNSSTNRLEL